MSLGCVFPKGLLKLLESRSKPSGDNLLDLASGICQSGRIGRRWSVQIDAMSTSIAVNEDVLEACCCLVGIEVSHASVLPGVLNGIDEDDVVSCDVDTAVEAVVVVDCWRSDILSKDVLAPLKPVCGVKEC